ncbi:MAG: porin [Pseudomonadota bacterium]
MKKLTVLLALLGAFVTSASAQSSVTMYGVVDLGIERTKLSPGPSVTALTSGIQSGSRLGFKGSEDLGGGLSAAFQLEMGLDASTGAATQGGIAFGRQAWVGLNGGFGSVKLGRQYIPLFLALDTIDPFGTGITGDGSGIIAVFRHYGVRMNNTVNYSTPGMGGFSAEFAYGLGEVPGSTSTGSQYGGSVTYAGGPLTVVGAFHRQDQVAGVVSTGSSRTAMLGAVYDLQAVTLNAAYATNRDENAGGASTGDSRDLMVGMTAPIGATTLMASYVRHSDKFLGNADAKYVQVGSLGTTGSGTAGVGISWLNVGIRHKF